MADLRRKDRTMATDRFLTPHFGALELEPMDGAAGAAPTGRAVFNPETRTAPRRKGGERREKRRVQEPRRAGDDRRAQTGWDKAKP
jgi:hypothetical protein